MGCLMRFRFVLPLILLLFMSITAAVSRAQDDPDLLPEVEVVDVDGLPKQMIDGIADISTGTAISQNQAWPQAISALLPSDNCEDAPPLVIIPGLNEGISANISFAKVVSSDPSVLKRATSMS